MNGSGPVTGFNHLAWEVDHGIGKLILNRPPSNEMTIAFFDEMHALIPMIRDHPGLRGIIVTGAGRHFSSGAALDELAGRYFRKRRGKAASECPYHELL